MISVGVDRYDPSTEGMSRSELKSAVGEVTGRTPGDVPSPSWWDLFLASQVEQS